MKMVGLMLWDDERTGETVVAETAGHRQATAPAGTGPRALRLLAGSAG